MKEATYSGWGVSSVCRNHQGVAGCPRTGRSVASQPVDSLQRSSMGSSETAGGLPGELDPAGVATLAGRTATQPKVAGQISR